MILKNYYNLLELTLRRTWSGSSLTILNPDNNITDVNGDNRTGMYGDMALLEGSHIEPVFGDGTTPPTALDYKLENELTGLYILSDSFNRIVAIDGEGNPYIIINITCTITNNSGTDYTISEVGIQYKDFHYQSGSYYCPILLTRQIISPIVLPNAETVSLPIQFIIY